MEQKNRLVPIPFASRGLALTSSPDKVRLMGLLLVHIVVGLLATRFNFVLYFLQAGILAWGFYSVIINKDNRLQAATASAYFCGLEVMLRMTGTIFYWELGKYGVIFLLGLGLLFSGKANWTPYVVYFLLLLPSIAVADYPDLSYAKDQLSFNLSGPLCFAVSGAYFYKRRVSFDHIARILRAILWPIISMVIYIVIVSPNFSKINFGSGSNFAASAGYGPNQVSVLFGAGIFILFLLIFFKAEFSGSRTLDYGIMVLLLFRALLTFSRGGVIGAALGIAVFLLLYSFITDKARSIFKYLGVVLFVAAGSYYVWNYTNELTNNALEDRYLGIDVSTGQAIRDYSSGRTELLLKELEAFVTHPVFGIGPGMIKLFRRGEFGQGVPSHSEMSRLLAEHGLFGITAIFLLIYFPIRSMYSGNPSYRPMSMAFLCLVFFSTFHAAVRLAIIPYIYGLSLILPIIHRRVIFSKDMPRKVGEAEVNLN